MVHTDCQNLHIDKVQLIKETVGKHSFSFYLPFQEEGSHHRDIGKRQQQGSDDAEHQCLCHRCEVFPFDARQRQDREKHNQDNQYGKSGRTRHFACAFFYFGIHLCLRKLASYELPPVNMSQYAFQNNNGTVHHNSKVYRPQAHQVGRNSKHAHQNKGKQHGKRNDRSYNQPGTHIAEKHNQYQKYDDRTFYQVTDNGGDIPVHQFRTVQVRLNADALGQHLLYLFYPFPKFGSDNIGISPFQHHGNATHTLPFPIDGHGSKALGTSETYISHITYVYGDTVTVCHYNVFYILQAAYHSFRTDIIGSVHFLDVTATRILIVTIQRFEHFPDGDIERVECIRIHCYLILLQVTTETINFHDTGNTGQLPFHDPILNGAQLHRIVFVLIAGCHLQRILVNFTQPSGNRHQLRST